MKPRVFPDVVFLLAARFDMTGFCTGVNSLLRVTRVLVFYLDTSKNGKCLQHCTVILFHKHNSNYFVDKNKGEVCEAVGYFFSKQGPCDLS